MTTLIVHGLAALVPVAVYLAGLVVMDSYKLVKPRVVLGALLAGCAAAAVCRLLNVHLLQLTGMPVRDYARYVAPLFEEAAKAVFLVHAIRSGRVGFAIDAAILGFAVGAGFGLLENILYMRALADAGIVTWVLRGCGTALMHGGTTAVMGIVSQGRQERRPQARFSAYLPGLGLVVILHSLYNHFLFSPALAAVGLLLGVPLATLAVFRRSERDLEDWLGLGYDADAEILASFGTGEFGETRVGHYLVSRRDRFPPPVVADMFCLIQLNVELSIHAKGLLLMRRHGYDAAPGPDVADKLREIAFLERSLGPTGRLALLPFLGRGRREAWEGHLLARG
jgi:protease PrsW